MVKNKLELIAEKLEPNLHPYSPHSHNIIDSEFITLAWLSQKLTRSLYIVEYGVGNKSVLWTAKNISQLNRLIIVKKIENKID